MIDGQAHLERISQSIAARATVCLLGAGFSLGATDSNGDALPSTAGLINEIKIQVGIDSSEDASLADIAEYCESSPSLRLKLQQLLIKRLTLTNPTANQRTIIAHPWRSVFTTNFDDLVERCLPASKIQSVSPTSALGTREPDKVPLYYLHGRAKDLVESDRNPRLVISESNYLNLHEQNRDLYARLQNELFAAKLIVIVGYSMRDLEVARLILGDGYAFRAKTMIICGPDEGALSISRLKKFGSVLPIGVYGLAAELDKTPPTLPDTPPPLQFIEEAPSVDPDQSIESDDFIRLILTGSFDKSKYLGQIQQRTPHLAPYCVRRTSALDIVLSRQFGDVRRFLISSDFGNGKTILLDQLASELAVGGTRVIQISSRLPEVFSELELTLGTAEPTAFLIDDVIRYRDAAKFIASRLNTQSILVCCMRGDAGEVAFKELENELGGAVRHIDLNRLTLDELQAWDAALERWGLWEQRISLSSAERLRFLAEDCSAENRSIVLALFRTSQIAAKIDQIVDFFLKRGRHEKAFAALLISSLCQQHVSWESLVSWVGINQQSLREDLERSDLSSLFHHGREWNIFTSSQLAEYILRTKYVLKDKDTLLEVFSTVVLSTAESAGDSTLGAIFRENLKELMKFRFLTRLFGDDDSAVKIISRVYRRLSEAYLIRDNPQFWLQYAMSRVEVDDLVNAETYLNTALGLATARGKSYSPFQILDQRARLYFRKNTTDRGRFKVGEIRSAISDLGDIMANPESELIYLYRSVPFIYAFVELNIDDMGQDIREDLLNLLQKIESRGQGVTKLPRSQKGETRLLQKAMDDVLRVLRFG